MAAPVSHKIAAGLAALYGVVSLVGGIIGYVKANSVESLIAGGISGILLLVCAGLVFRKSCVALGCIIAVSIALLTFFLPKALNPPTDPAKEGAAARAIGMSAGGVLVLLSAGFALSGGRRGGS
jgi:uncharacterized membrane protein (UPF0136 family)